MAQATDPAGAPFHGVAQPLHRLEVARVASRPRLPAVNERAFACRARTSVRYGMRSPARGRSTGSHTASPMAGRPVRLSRFSLSATKDLSLYQVLLFSRAIRTPEANAPSAHGSNGLFEAGRPPGRFRQVG